MRRFKEVSRLFLSAAASPAKAPEKASGCPFSAMVAEMGLTSGGKPANGGQ